MIEAINNIPGVPKAVGSYSPAIKTHSFLFLSGQIGLNPKTQTLETGGIEAQAKRALENMKALLQASGSSFDNVVMTTIFLTDINHANIVNEIYSSYVNSEHPPARQTVCVKELPLGALIEISAIAQQ